MSSRLVIASLALATALGVSACGGSDKPSAPASTSGGGASNAAVVPKPPVSTTCPVSTSGLVAASELNTMRFAQDQDPTISVAVDAPQFSPSATKYVGCKQARELVAATLTDTPTEPTFECATAEMDDSAAATGSATNTSAAAERQNPDGTTNPRQEYLCTYKSTQLGQITYRFTLTMAAPRT